MIYPGHSHCNILETTTKWWLDWSCLHCSAPLPHPCRAGLQSNHKTRQLLWYTMVYAAHAQYKRASVNAALATWSSFTRIRPIFWDLAVPYFIWLVVVKQSIDIREKNSFTSISFVFREMFNYSAFARYYKHPSWYWAYKSLGWGGCSWIYWEQNSDIFWWTVPESSLDTNTEISEWKLYFPSSSSGVPAADPLPSASIHWPLLPATLGTIQTSCQLHHLEIPLLE